jgi:transglutaminase-like putative cysteine protease
VLKQEADENFMLKLEKRFMNKPAGMIQFYKITGWQQLISLVTHRVSLLKYFLLFVLSVLWNYSQAQENTVPFGDVSLRDISMKVYERDTAAAALVLKEYGDAFIDSDNFNLVFTYHVQIKILKTAGLEHANVEIPLYKQDARVEKIRTLKASSFNLEQGRIEEKKLLDRNIFTENQNKYWDVKKFAIPNVRVGSIIEFHYVLESPFIYNFRPWKFQADIPKVRSSFRASIPGNYLYNISLKGFLPLSVNEHKIVRDCFRPAGRNADCAVYTWAMENIPAFVEEDYMTAKSNFLASINFELSEIRYFDGRRDKITLEWKDAEEELRRDQRFGLQLRRGKDILDDHVELVLQGEKEPLQKAKKIYGFINGWFRWNDVYGKYSELGIKKAFDQKTGNVADINLALVAALRFAGLQAEPVLLSTRSNGMPTELHPVLSDFNYVIAKVTIADKVYLLDATEDHLPFGLLPERCLNGKGRVLGEKESYWYDLAPAERAKQITVLNLRLDIDGYLRGQIQNTFIGYEAVFQRRKVLSHASIDDYVQETKKKQSKINIEKLEVEGAADPGEPMVEKYEVEIQAFDHLEASHFLFNPFVVERWERNPFRSPERLYPVDFAVPFEEVIILNLELPEGLKAIELPAKVGLLLPEGGGRYIYEVKSMGNRIIMNSSLLIARTVFTSVEYHFLKELFNRVVQVQNTDLIFRKK